EPTRPRPLPGGEQAFVCGPVGSPPGGLGRIKWTPFSFSRLFAVSHRIVCLADPDAHATLSTMNPVEPDRSQRRIALYFVAVLAVILTPLFFVFWLYNQQAPSGGDEFARWMNTGKSYYEQGKATNA